VNCDLGDSQQGHKVMNTEVEGSVALEAVIQTAGEHTADCEDLVHAVVNCRVCAVEIFFYYYLVCEAIGTAATPGLLC
jgi:hypothetical protein